MPTTIREAKRALRERLRANRSALDAHALAVAARALRDSVLELPGVDSAGAVAAYVSVGDEPGTGPLIEELSERGIDILLPVLQPDFDLDWAPYRGPSALVKASRGLLEPAGPTAGPESVLEVDAVILPALAVDRRGTRLGQGGGCYDRVLARLGGSKPAYVLLHDGELLDMPIPREPHDVPVDTVVTPSGVHRMRG
ncbi:5-formyltetrahydrofolate cyclo-ligase [Phytoactinopolyspora limicola]|uniref:5-formyltetrahydrofolate cyclo-ligase n=1 Tax=Phytoactinopolyspora limicola TaxID=2715536 RepID=UPI001B7D82FC|nr:5-formyltetrahydrofolate cyclo-ligase [Phytoactinopolyspora limicola]